METKVAYVVNGQPAAKAKQDHLATASDLLAELEDNIRANPGHWVSMVQCHALIDIAHSLRRIARGVSNAH